MKQPVGWKDEEGGGGVGGEVGFNSLFVPLACLLRCRKVKTGDGWERYLYKRKGLYRRGESLGDSSSLEKNFLVKNLRKKYGVAEDESKGR